MDRERERPRVLATGGSGFERDGADLPRGVAAQVEFERHILKPVFSLDRCKGWNQAPFSYEYIWVRGIQRAPPHHGGGGELRGRGRGVAVHVCI